MFKFRKTQSLEIKEVAFLFFRYINIFSFTASPQIQKEVIFS